MKDWMKKSLLSFLLLLVTAPAVWGQGVPQGEVIPGTYKPFKVSPDGFSTTMGVDLATGFAQAGTVRRVAGLGFNPDVDTGTVPEDVWPGGGLYPWLTVATNLEIVSTSALDTAAGTGARTISVACLDANYVEIPQTIALNGTTAVPIPLACLRVNGLALISAGTGRINAGDISVRDAGGGTVRSIMPLGYGVARQSIFTVPAGYTLQVTSIYIAGLTAGGAATNFDVSTFLQASNGGRYILPITITTGSGGVYRHDSTPGIVVGEKVDFALRITAVNVSNTQATGAWLGLMVKN